jgi:hypothetical protein
VGADYDAGFEAGRASRDAEFEALEAVADYWYFRACNPGVKTADQKIIDSIIAGKEAVERRQAKYKELDALEEAWFNHARQLISDTDLTDIQIAVKVGLFAPTVAHIREEMGREAIAFPPRQSHTEPGAEW